MTFIWLLIFIIIISLLICFFVSSYIGKILKKKSENKNVIAIRHSEENKIENITESQMKKEITYSQLFKFSRKDWLHRRKRILMQKISRIKNRK